MQRESNILIDRLPEVVVIGDEEYEIRSDFRASVMFELLMQETAVDDREKLVRGLYLYYPEIPSNIEGAVEALIWFYSCGREDNTTDDQKGDKKRNERIYSYNHDAAYIYSAFMGQYGIDLQDVDYLHWWKFKAMFTSLHEDQQMSKIMHYRSVEITKEMSKKEAKFYRRMKRLYALPRPQSEVQRDKAIRDALMNGGDLTGIL